MDYKKEVINGDMTEMNAQQLEGVSGGLVEGGGVSCLNHKLGPDIRKSLSLDGTGTLFVPSVNVKCS